MSAFELSGHGSVITLCPLLTHKLSCSAAAVLRYAILSDVAREA
jgi:hypothetical protein